MTQYFHMNTWYQLITTVLPWLILSYHLCHPAHGNSDTSSVKCFDEERKALLQFKDGINKDYCGLLASWRDDSDCCQWHAVNCSNNTGHVTMLRLQGSYYNNCIEGILSPSLPKLKHLRHLDLDFNYFHPPIPSFLGSLTNLEYLSLKYAFDFVISSSHVQDLNWLSHLSLLRYLDLSGTDLSETENWIQIMSKLPFLGVLHMDWCQLPVNIPSSLAHINSSSNLRVISLSENNFNYSSMFQGLFNLPGITTQLVYLDLSSNLLKGPIPNDFGNLHHLSHLDLSHNQVEGPVPNDFWNLHHLSHLDLSYNRLEGPVPNNFWKLHHLSYLDLSNNQLKGPIPNEFGNLHHLSHLDLSYNHLEGHIPIEFKSMDSISYLSLSYNNLQGSFQMFSRLCNLQQLDLSANNFTDEIANVIQALSSCENATLLTLDLSQNHFCGAIPDSISSLTSLRELNLLGNQINKISKGIGQLTMLEKLDISSNSLEDTLTHIHFINLPRLHELYLSDNPRLVIDIDASWVPPFQLDKIRLVIDIIP